MPPTSKKPNHQKYQLLSKAGDKEENSGTLAIFWNIVKDKLQCPTLMIVGGDYRLRLLCESLLRHSSFESFKFTFYGELVCKTLGMPCPLNKNAHWCHSAPICSLYLSLKFMCD